MNIKKLDSNIGPYRSPDLGVLEINKMRTVEDMIEYTTAAISTHNTTEVTFHRKPEPHLVISKLEYGAEVRRERHVYKDQYIALGEDGDYYGSSTLDRLSPVFTEEEFKDLKAFLKDLHDNKNDDDDVLTPAETLSVLAKLSGTDTPSEKEDNILVSFSKSVAYILYHINHSIAVELEDASTDVLMSWAKTLGSNDVVKNSDFEYYLSTWSTLLYRDALTDEMWEAFNDEIFSGWQWYVTSNRCGFLWKNVRYTMHWYLG